MRLTSDLHSHNLEKVLESDLVKINSTVLVSIFVE